MAPTPHRGKVCHSSLALHTVREREERREKREEEEKQSENSDISLTLDLGQENLRAEAGRPGHGLCTASRKCKSNVQDIMRFGGHRRFLRIIIKIKHL